MRVTNPIRRDQTPREIQGNLARLSELQTQVATGKRFSRTEEDPQATAQVLRAERGMRASFGASEEHEGRGAGGSELGVIRRNEVVTGVAIEHE